MKIFHVHENAHGRHGALIGEDSARWVNDHELEKTKQGTFAVVKVIEVARPPAENEPCNRSACRKPGADWWNIYTNAWYCEACAKLINQGYHRSPICFPTK